MRGLIRGSLASLVSPAILAGCFAESLVRPTVDVSEIGEGEVPLIACRDGGDCLASRMVDGEVVVNQVSVDTFGIPEIGRDIRVALPVTGAWRRDLAASAHGGFLLVVVVPPADPDAPEEALLVALDAQGNVTRPAAPFLIFPGDRFLAIVSSPEEDFVAYFSGTPSAGIGPLSLGLLTSSGSIAVGLGNRSEALEGVEQLASKHIIGAAWSEGFVAMGEWRREGDTVSSGVNVMTDLASGETGKPRYVPFGEPGPHGSEVVHGIAPAPGGFAVLHSLAPFGVGMPPDIRTTFLTYLALDGVGSTVVLPDPSPVIAAVDDGFAVVSRTEDGIAVAHIDEKLRIGESVAIPVADAERAGWLPMITACGEGCALVAWTDSTGGDAALQTAKVAAVRNFSAKK